MKQNNSYLMNHSSISNPSNGFVEKNYEDLSFFFKENNMVSFDLLNKTYKVKSFQKVSNKYSKIIIAMATIHYKNVLMPMSTDDADINRKNVQVYI